MKHLLFSLIFSSFFVIPSFGKDIKIGILLGFTGPIESLTPDMASGAELAMQEATDSGLVLGGSSVIPVRADSTCTDSAAATSAAERLITSDGVVAIMGADCSGVTTAVTNNVAVPNGVVSISPSATSPALSSIDDKDYFFRTAPSDARQGEVLAKVVKGRDINELAITYVNNDYGKGLSDSFTKAYESLGGKVTINAAHEDGKADYAAEVGALAATGSEHLAVFGYVDQGGKGIIQASLDTDAFSKFVLADGMIGDSLTGTFGSLLDGSIGTVAGSDSEGATTFVEFAKASGIAKPSGPYVPESYDAAALIILAMQAASSDNRAAIQSKVMSVANAPGIKISSGELAKGLQILQDGGEVNYEGATNVKFTDVGESTGSFKELVVKGGKFETVQIHR